MAPTGIATKKRPAQQGRDEPAPSIRTVALRSRRRLPWVAAGLLVMALSTAAFVLALSRVSTRAPVVAVTRDVATGDVLSAEDLTVVEAGVDAGIAVVPGDERERLLGRVAAGPLPAGSLLAEGMLRDGSRLPDGMQVVGLALDAGDYPVTDLSVGDRVSVVSTVPAAGEDPVLGIGQVWEIAPLGDVSDALFVSVAVPEDAAPAVASSAGRDEARVVWLGAAR